jgi:hypothetical protein
MTRSKASILLSLATSLIVPAALAQNTTSARPGTINYVEGQATLNGQPLSTKTNGTTQISQGQTLETQNGKVEVLLTPGVFLRIGDNTAITMVAPDLTNTEIQLDRGTAEVEVDQIYKQNNLLVDEGATQTKLLKNGLYEFDANSNTMRVFDGEAAVSLSQDAKNWIKVKGHHELALNGDEQKPRSFNPDQIASNDALYNWSKLRADYLGRANQQLAQEYAGAPGFYPGWYWNPWVYSYTWLPGDGLFWSPFGYGFYSPAYIYGGGFIYPVYRVGPVYRGYVGHEPYRGSFGYRDGAEHGGHASSAAPGGGFRGAAGGFHAQGGFHGGVHRR